MAIDCILSQTFNISSFTLTLELMTLFSNSVRKLKQSDSYHYPLNFLASTKTVLNAKEIIRNKHQAVSIRLLIADLQKATIEGT
jgi:hypothetical protein